METAIVSLVCVAILLIGTVTTVMTSFNAANKVADSLKEWEKQSTIIRGTEISLTPPANYQSGSIEIWVDNTGDIGISDFPKWDIIAQWQRNGAEQVAYLSYNEGEAPGFNQWAVEGIYLPDEQPEVFEPRILNAGEKMKILINLNPAMVAGDAAMITISSAAGVTAQCIIQTK